MIRAVVFDLDGTLVQTERLKALSYARAATELCPGCASEQEIIEAFKSVVGRSREEVAKALMQRFGLERAAAARMIEFGVTAPWQAFVQVRLRIYEKMIADPEVIRASQWPHQIALLRKVRRMGLKTGLATTARTEQTCRILDVLGLTGEFDFIATADDVEHSKPAPEVYLLVSRELGVPPAKCLAVEDSPAGVRSALAARVHCIAVTTPFTREAIHTSKLLDKQWIVDDPAELDAVVGRMIAERERD